MSDDEQLMTAQRHAADVTPINHPTSFGVVNIGQAQSTSKKILAPFINLHNRYAQTEMDLPATWHKTKCQHPSKAVREGPYTLQFLNTISAKLGAKYVIATDFTHLPRYQYSEIKGARHVRLMILQPAGFFGAPLRCRLIEIGLGARPFEALSYVWGSTADLQPLLCHNQLLQITQSLDAALRFLRRKTQERYLWVDAVCINQDDSCEKETQIPLMRDLYTTAKHSLIWLGGPDVGARGVFWTARLTQPLTHLADVVTRAPSKLNAEHAFERNVTVVTNPVRIGRCCDVEPTNQQRETERAG